MKSVSYLSALFLISVVFISCSKSNTSTNNSSSSNLPAPVSSIASAADITSLKSSGMTINEGTTPPVVNGIYLQHPDSCIFDNSGNNSAGKFFADYKFRFSNQNNSSFAISVDLKDVTNYTDSASYSANTYISGSGNSFTIFAQVNGSLGGVTYTELDTYSGTLTSKGVQNFQWSFYLKSKSSDPNNVHVVSVGTTRVFNTGAPGMATVTTNY
jgi:hypothetical protein